MTQCKSLLRFAMITGNERLSKTTNTSISNFQAGYCYPTGSIQPYKYPSVRSTVRGPSLRQFGARRAFLFSSLPGEVCSAHQKLRLRWCSSCSVPYPVSASPSTACPGFRLLSHNTASLLVNMVTLNWSRSSLTPSDISILSPAYFICFTLPRVTQLGSPPCNGGRQGGPVIL